MATISQEGYFPSHKPVWSITKKPSGSSSAVSSSTGGTTVVSPLDKVGEYIVKADCNGNVDTIKIIVYRVEFQRDPDVHRSIEGHLPGGGTQTGLLGTYGTAASNPLESVSVLVASSYNFSFQMTSQGAQYVADKGTGAFLQPSGEIRYLMFLNLGDAANVAVKVTADYTSVISISPVSSHINNGASTIIALGGTSKTHAKGVVGGQLRENGDSEGSLVWSGTASGRFQLPTGQNGKAKVEPGVSYLDYGAQLGQASASIEVTITVERP
jgi:hypothetical protein